MDELASIVEYAEIASQAIEQFGKVVDKAAEIMAPG